MAFDSFRYF